MSFCLSSIDSNTSVIKNDRKILINVQNYHSITWGTPHQFSENKKQSMRYSLGILDYKQNMG
jgi:hypothetical protein